MIYLGSKRRIAKEIVTIMLLEAQKRKIKTWVEPFVGGGNTIIHVPQSFRRIGIDINPHTIAALIGIRDYANELPVNITEDEYNNMKGTPPHPITSWCRYVGAFGGIFENTYVSESKRILRGKNSAMRQSRYLQGVELICGNYDICSNIENAVIYCDIPYKGVTGYDKRFCGKFDYDGFYDWCKMMSEKNVVFVSEYDMPSDFVCVWEKEVSCKVNNNVKDKDTNRIERLFTIDKKIKKTKTIQLQLL